MHEFKAGNKNWKTISISRSLSQWMKNFQEHSVHMHDLLQLFGSSETSKHWKIQVAYSS
jgi:hypothetical protein